MKNLSFDEFCASKAIKLTDLRKAILAILFKNSSISAYEILNELRKKRPGAEPPTVYRVLEWLLNAKLIHRVEAQNTYVLCSKFAHEKSAHKTILLSCRQCHNSYEFEDQAMMRSIQKFVEKFQVEVDDTLIEMKGLCDRCVVKKTRAKNK